MKYIAFLYVFVQDAYRLYSFVEITRILMINSSTEFLLVCFLTIIFKINKVLHQVKSERENWVEIQSKGGR